MFSEISVDEMISTLYSLWYGFGVLAVFTARGVNCGGHDLKIDDTPSAIAFEMIRARAF